MNLSSTLSVIAGSLKLSGAKLASHSPGFFSTISAHGTGSKREQIALAPLCSLLDCGGRGGIET
jgi:hypothetical protein